MKNIFSQVGMVLSFSAVLIVSSCKKADDETSSSGGKVPPSVVYPIETTLTDVEGRTLDVMLLGRSETSVSFMRKADWPKGKLYDLEISKLNVKDKMRMKKFPLKAPKKAAEVVAKAKKDDALTRYIEFREKEIERQKRTLADKMLDQDKAVTSTKKNQVNRDIQALEKEIEKLEMEISNANKNGI
jgi:hypothetical protein